jgi:hypothetical protein
MVQTHREIEPDRSLGTALNDPDRLPSGTARRLSVEAA